MFSRISVLYLHCSQTVLESLGLGVGRLYLTVAETWPCFCEGGYCSAAEGVLSFSLSAPYVIWCCQRALPPKSMRGSYRGKLDHLPNFRMSFVPWNPILNRQAWVTEYQLSQISAFQRRFLIFSLNSFSDPTYAFLGKLGQYSRIWESWKLPRLQLRL